MCAFETALANYTKGEVIHLDDSAGSSRFQNVPDDVVTMRVQPNSKLRNILGFAFKALKDPQNRHIIVHGSSDGIYRAISCAEIIKKKLKTLHQITKISYLKLEEYWEPKNPELDRLKVTREIPQIHILLCKDALGSSEPGYQAPDHVNFQRESDYKRKWKENRPKRSQRQAHEGSEQTVSEKPGKREKIQDK